MTPSADVLLGLRDKYREIKRLRDEAAAGGARDPAPALSALSARFPGALRELDQRTMDDIEARLQALELALSGAQPAARWMELCAAYHGLVRVALRIKQRRADGVEALWAELQRSYRPAPDEPPLSALGRQGVAEILHPPGGRLNAWVFQRLGQPRGLAPPAVEALIFGPAT